ncbi:hypothetical protein CASFOL_001446 [Castilleja foliolosa]|uniref:CCHC-type domain-containing protein n=1 Tax=Castilleja foliolosa TaxID=1961234 RepID=A0ABD3EKD6_9LAMI
MKLFVFTVFLFLVLSKIGIDADVSISDVDDHQYRSDGPDSSVLEQLKSKIHSLEYHIEEKAREINDKDVVVAAKEKLINEKSESIVALKSEIASLQKKETSDVKEQLGKAHARAGELENQVEKLKKDLEVKVKEKEQLEARITENEKKAFELNTKVDSLLKIIDNQQAKLQKTERALKIAEVVFTPGQQDKCFICGQVGHLAAECEGKAKIKAGEFDEKGDADIVPKKPFQAD